MNMNKIHLSHGDTMKGKQIEGKLRNNKIYIFNNYNYIDIYYNT